MVRAMTFMINGKMKKKEEMSKLRVHTFSISLDGFGAGPNQDLNNPANSPSDLGPILRPTFLRSC